MQYDIQLLGPSDLHLNSKPLDAYQSLIQQVLVVLLSDKDDPLRSYGTYFNKQTQLVLDEAELYAIVTIALAEATAYVRDSFSAASTVNLVSANPQSIVKTAKDSIDITINFKFNDATDTTISFEV